jgi:hypothetical protein
MYREGFVYKTKDIPSRYRNRPYAFSVCLQLNEVGITLNRLDNFNLAWMVMRSILSVAVHNNQHLLIDVVWRDVQTQTATLSVGTIR